MTDLVELESGVDTLHVSGRCELGTDFLEDLERCREEVRTFGAPISYAFGGYDWLLKPGPLNKHRYRLEHPIVTLGISPSHKLRPRRIRTLRPIDRR